MKDIFGGEVDYKQQRQNGHFWVGMGTPVEHCMQCRRGPTKEWCVGHANCVCGRHLDEHQDGGGCGGFKHRE